MKRIACLFIFISLLCPTMSRGADEAVFLNAFGETATAYLNDSFLLMGTTADGFVGDIIPKGTALEIATNVRKRVRIIRAKFKAVSASRISNADKHLIGLLDNAYGCLDHQAQALIEYIQDKTPDTARHFEAQRTDCLNHIKKIADYYSTLPPSPEVPKPLSTR